MKKNAIIAIVAVVVVVLLGVGGFFITKDMRQEKILIEEISKISSMDATKDNFDDLPIKTTGDYATVEKAVKSYLKEFSDVLKSTMEVMQDEKIAQLLSGENIKNDGPEFVQTKEYINNSKTKFNENVTKLIKMCDEETMMENIKKENLGAKFEELYKNLMFDDKVKQDLKTSQKQMETASKQINNVFDTQLEIVEFLNKNKNNWEVNSSNQVVFTTQSLVNQYNALVRKLS